MTDAPPRDSLLADPVVLVKSVREMPRRAGGSQNVPGRSGQARVAKPATQPKERLEKAEKKGPPKNAKAPLDKKRDAAEDDANWTEVAHEGVSHDLAPVVGGNLRRLRVQRGLSLEKLSKASGVSRAMLGQIELGKSAPTINVLWKIARALEIPFSALIRDQGVGGTVVMPRDRAKKLMSHDGTFTSRALFPFDVPRNVEFYELRLTPLAVERADAHPPGTIENLVVSQGSLELSIGKDQHSLSAGDAILFEADVPHVYRNPLETELLMYLVMTYPASMG